MLTRMFPGPVFAQQGWDRKTMVTYNAGNLPMLVLLGSLCLVVGFLLQRLCTRWP
jgi:hypothetical protein